MFLHELARALLQFNAAALILAKPLAVLPPGLWQYQCKYLNSGERHMPSWYY